MQPIVRRLRPFPQPAPGRRGPLPSYLLFAPGLAPVEAAAALPAARKGTSRRRTSVLMFLERVLCAT
jgi:hypothetical protein